jgi:hypothetical protein
MFKGKFLLAWLAITLLLLSSCSGSSNSEAAASAVQDYWQAMVSRDLNQAIAHSCAGWETQARTEFNSFSAVKLKLENVACKVKSQAAAEAQVTCTGVIIANYGAEDLTIDIANRIYRVVNESGEWRMCGYQQ